MSSHSQLIDSSLVALWGLRLLRLGLESGGLSSLTPLRKTPPRGPKGFDEMMAELQGKPPPPPRPRGRMTSSQQVAEEIAGLLELEFDAAKPGAIKGLRGRLDRMIQSADRPLRSRPTLEALSPEARASIDSLGRLLDLSPDEQLCLAFVLMLSTDEKLERAAAVLGHDLDDHAADRAVARATGLPIETVSRAFASNGRIVGCQLLKRDSNNLRLTGKFDWPSRNFARDMRQPGFDPLRAMRDRVVPAPAPKLGWEQFEHLGDLRALTLTYCRQALEQRKRAVNLLLWGPPGCGKTEFVRTLARELKCELYEVTTEDSDGDPISGGTRLQALRVAQEFTSRRRTMVVFDELEDAVPRTVAPPFGGPNRSPLAKGWINRTLETNQTLTVWITNAVDALDPAFTRRFDIVIEMKAPPARVRAEQFRALPGALAEETILRLTGSEHVTPGIVARAADVAATVAASDPGLNVSRHVELLVNQTLRAQGHAPLKPSLAAPDIYDPRLIHCDVDPVGLVEGLRNSRSGRICFFGPPGTGKTAFAQHIARELGLRLLERRASDLLSPYVGLAEKNIAAAFAEAEEAGSALLIDEVDSFLQDRSRAHRSWEVTQVNEFLTQMEKFAGLFIASTNLIDGFDAAALRRFDLKAKFQFLRDDQALTLLASHLRAAGLAAALPSDEARLRALSVLTPGDFAAVARQGRFRPLPTAAEWISALEAECRHKQGQSRAPIGFGRTA